MSGILAAGVGVLGTMMTNQQNANLNAANRAWQSYQNNLAYARQRQLIQEQNEYNSFSNQKKLMKEAGYNPYNMVSGIGSTAVSTSSTAAPQAGTPQSFPFQGLDAASINALADARLKKSQADNLDADTIKKAAETSYQNVMKDYQEMQNRIFKEYGEYEKILGLEKERAEMIFTNAQTDFTRVQEKLADYDLSNMKPAELANVVADTLKTQADQYLSEVQAAKTDEERRYISKQFALQVRLVNAQVLAYVAQANASNAQAAWTNNQTGLWSPKGILYEGAKADSQTRIRDYNLTHKYIDSYENTFRNNLFSDEFLSEGRLRRSRLRGDYQPKWKRTLVNALDEMSNFIPLSGSISGPLVTKISPQ
ncbi:DNA pilot protein [Peromfec virus RodF7_4]|uniref:DNA pilot protein n=1 Tax=Peromfec virus RodF7_4 TaxID=2929353 RepID=A0A976N394_9VIRU|nr:DNA pilot protein [Peromfec virus RodF7_4]